MVIGLILGRVLVSVVFVGLGLERLLMGLGLVGREGTPVSAGALAFSAFELIAGVLICFGWRVRWVAAVLAAFLLVDAVASHPFWAATAGAQHGQLLHFLKNVSIVGCLLLLIGVDAQARRDSA